MLQGFLRDLTEVSVEVRKILCWLFIHSPSPSLLCRLSLIFTCNLQLIKLCQRIKLPHAMVNQIEHQPKVQYFASVFASDLALTPYLIFKSTNKALLKIGNSTLVRIRILILA